MAIQNSPPNSLLATVLFKKEFGAQNKTQFAFSCDKEQAEWKKLLRSIERFGKCFGSAMRGDVLLCVEGVTVRLHITRAGFIFLCGAYTKQILKLIWIGHPNYDAVGLP